MKKKKSKPSYQDQLDENGCWKDEKRLFIGAIRRLFRQAPQFGMVFSESRKEVDKFNKDGSKSKKPSVFKQCEVCNEWFPSGNIAIDHKEPMTKLYLTNEEMTFDEIRQNIICHKSNLQRICNPKKGKKPGFLEFCHQKKTHLENFLRKKWSTEFLLNNIQSRKDKEHFVKLYGSILESKWAEEYTIDLTNKYAETEAKAERKKLKEEKRKIKKINI